MDRLIGALARGMAVIGGLVLTALVLLVCVSILGRGIAAVAFSDSLSGLPALAEALKASGIRQIRGDFELLESGIAFAIFAFLPICQFSGGHATVDIFTDRLPGRATPWLIAFWEAVLALAICLIAWRLWIGTGDKMGNGTTTFILRLPVWWSYAASTFAACVAAVTALWCACMRVREAAGGRPFPKAEGPAA